MVEQITFSPVNYEKLSSIIEGQIRQRILAGEFRPGDRLPSENEICRQFGVSLVTVREALKGLETYGLVEKRKGKGGGVFVSELRSEMVKRHLFHFLNQKKFSSKDLSELRMIIEPVACRIATTMVTDEIIDMLEENVRRGELLMENAGRSFSEDDFSKLEESNMEFHSLIGEATQNPVLALTIDYVLDFLFNFKKMTLMPDRKFSLSVINDHKVILSQLKKRNGLSAEKAMVYHLQSVEDYLAEQEKAKQNGAGKDKKRNTK